MQQVDWFSDIQIELQKEKAYMFMANIGMNNSVSLKVRTKELEELCQKRSPDLPFQDTRPPTVDSSGLLRDIAWRSYAHSQSQPELHNAVCHRLL